MVPEHAALEISRRHIRTGAFSVSRFRDVDVVEVSPHNLYNIQYGQRCKQLGTDCIYLEERCLHAVGI